MIRRNIIAYAVAVVAVGGAAAATLGLGSAVKHAPTLFFCSVVLSSWFGGVGSGIFAGLLSVIALDYYFIPPIYALGIRLEEAPDMIVFVASAVFVSWLSREQKRAKPSVKQASDEPDTKVDGRTAKFWKTNEPSQAETSGEPADSIAHETNEKIGEVEELPHEFRSQTPPPEEESVFLKEGDYWTIRYQGRIVCLKATRGLQYLAILLGHPDRVFHARLRNTILLAVVTVGFAILAVAFATAIPEHDAVDAAISVALNKLVGLSPLTDKALVQIAGSSLIGSVVVALIWACWFRFVGKPERIRICVGMLATTGAGIVSRLLQLFLKFHLRPVFDTSLNLTLASGVRPEGLHAWSSFPSDTLTLLGALTCVIALCDLRLGLVAFVLSAIVGFARVATGIHWASDVVFGFLLGTSIVWFASKIPLPKFIYAVDLESPWLAFCAFLLSFQNASFYYSIQMAVKLIVPSITP